jgi:hypothetical protein
MLGIPNISDNKVIRTDTTLRQCNGAWTCDIAIPRGLLHSKRTNREYDPLPHAIRHP